MTMTAPLPLRRLPSDQDASGRNLGREELHLVSDALTSGTLTSTRGKHVPAFESAFAKRYGMSHAYACSSGSAAVHCAIAAIDPSPGDEIVTTPITDMGAIAPILYQGAIPVFADVDPRTYNVTAASIAKCITERTKAIIVTHLFGNPVEMEAILELARRNAIPVIEDCAQAFDATIADRPIGTFGTIACFSLQQGKHITTGEGGVVVTNDARLARRIFLFINKAWGYGDPNPDHYFLALNYRMSELCGAVAEAQLPKLDLAVRRRREHAAHMDELLANLPGIGIPTVAFNARHSYWKYAVDVDDRSVPGGCVALAKTLRDFDVVTAPRYIQKPAFECAVISQQRTFGRSNFPFSLASPSAVDYRRERFPGTYEALRRILVIPWNDRYTTDDVIYIADALRVAVTRLREESA